MRITDFFKSDQKNKQIPGQTLSQIPGQTQVTEETGLTQGVQGDQGKKEEQVTGPFKGPGTGGKRRRRRRSRISKRKSKKSKRRPRKSKKNNRRRRRRTRRRNN